ncbi:MAG: hypothetical protein ACI4J5_09275 [Oscillospiraceae bacterium]
MQPRNAEPASRRRLRKKLTDSLKKVMTYFRPICYNDFGRFFGGYHVGQSAAAWA